MTQTAAQRRKSRVPSRYLKLYDKVTQGKASPRMCIKAMCLECVDWRKEDVAGCTATACPLYQHRPHKGAKSSGGGG